MKDTLIYFSYNREIQTVTLTLGSLFTLTPNFNLKFYYSKSEEILLNQGYKMLKPSSIVRFKVIIVIASITMMKALMKLGGKKKVKITLH